MDSKQIVEELARNTKIITLKIAIINILSDLPKDERIEILKEMASMYQAEIDLGLAEDR